MPGGDELRGDAFDEEACLSAQNGVGGEEVGIGVEVGNELDEDERLCELGRLGRGLVWRDGRAAVRDRRDLESGETH